MHYFFKFGSYANLKNKLPLQQITQVQHARYRRVAQLSLPRASSLNGCPLVGFCVCLL